MESNNNTLQDALAYFWFLNILTLLFIPIIIIAATWALIFSPETIQLNLASLMSFLLVVVKVFASFVIIKLIKKQNKNSPQRIVDILAREFVLTAFLSVLIFFFVEKEYETISFSFLYFIFWVSYFKLSKNVLSYYGNNF
jgi:hypothetical protein